jgi:hypothetical protein
MKIVGWQIVHRETHDPPDDQATFEIYSFDFVSSWHDKQEDPSEWRLLPIREGTIENPVFVDEVSEREK